MTHSDHEAPGPIGLYDPADERDSCGVGFVAAIDGAPRRSVVEKGLDALKAVWHRGAVDADGKTGDGAGIHVQIPLSFFNDHIERTGHKAIDAAAAAPLAVGAVFLPRTDFGAQETCRAIVETEVLRLGYTIYGWRQVPVNVSVLGEKANATRPEVEQIMIANARGSDEETFERELYLIRRRVEKAVAAAQIAGFYICSLSCRSVIYKGMMLAEQVGDFYPDLQDPRFESAFAIYHQRYSTNTFPQWWLAQPFRMLAHNGEINTMKGNLNWMRSHEIRMASQVFGAHQEDLKPVVPASSSDSAALDAVFEVMVRAGRIAPMAKTMLIPEAWSNRATVMPESWRAMYAYSNSVMEPWDGPAAIAATDGRWVLAGADRNGLRPLRFVVDGEGLVIAGSEVGMVPTDESSVREKGRLGPGQMIAIDLVEGRLLHDAESSRTMLAPSGPSRSGSKLITISKARWLAAQSRRRGGRAPRARRAAHAAIRGRDQHRGSRDHPASDGRRRQGGDRLDGRRHADRGAVGFLPPAQPFLPPELQPGHQPADRPAARAAGDEPEDAVRQSQERARRIELADRDLHARERRW